MFNKGGSLSARGASEGGIPQLELSAPPMAYRRGRIVRARMAESAEAPSRAQSAIEDLRELSASPESIQGDIDKLKKEASTLQTTVFNLQLEIKELEDRKRQLQSGKKDRKKKVRSRIVCSS